jgi:2-oxoglutarate ferredoxin oxidoreductase subunit beta
MSTLHHDPAMPRPIGILRDVKAPIFEEAVHEQIRAARSKRGEGTLEQLIYSGETWKVA